MGTQKRGWLVLGGAAITVDAGVLAAGASGLLNLMAMPGPNGSIVLQHVPAVSAAALQAFLYLVSGSGGY